MLFPHREEYYKIREVCREFYHIVKGCFQHFCIIGNSASAEADYTISLSEFMIFAKAIRIIDGKLLHVTDVQRIFTLTNADRDEDATSGDDEFECHEFLEALIELQIYAMQLKKKELSTLLISYFIIRWHISTSIKSMIRTSKIICSNMIS